MNIQIERVTLERKRAFTQLINLYQFNHDFTEYINDDIPENGHFYGDSDYYLTNDKAHNFFIRVDGKLAGFVIIVDGGCLYLDDANAHNIDLFFVTKKYRRNGVGRFAAKTAFDMFKGKWEVCQMQTNIVAQKFWKSVISEYTKNNYQECGTENDEMVGFIFDN